MTRIRTRDGQFNRWCPINFDKNKQDAIEALNGMYYPDIDIIFFDTEEDALVFFLKTYAATPNSI